jgi:ribonuclease T2
MMHVCRNRALQVLLAATLLAAAPAQARHHEKYRQATGTGGDFDYYVLSLSWSPQHCASRPPTGSDRQCAGPRRYGFVLHGLWPQYEKGYPQTCATGAQVSSTTVDSLLDIMPSPQLVRHEWSKHGACSGLPPAAYFAAARGAFTSVKIPAAYTAPSDAFQTSTTAIEQAFVSANPGLAPEDVAVLCNGKFLQEVRVCLDKDLHVRRCGRDVRDACRAGVVIRPVR